MMTIVGILAFLASDALMSFTAYCVLLHIMNWRQNRDSHKTV